jgi:hypothetical protein
MISTILKTCVKPVTRDIPLVLAHQGAAGGTRQVAHVTTSTSGAAATVASTSASTACAQKLLHPICNLSIALYTQSPSSRTSPAAFSALEFTKQSKWSWPGGFWFSAHFLDVALQSLRRPLSSSKTKRTTTSSPTPLPPPAPRHSHSQHLHHLHCIALRASIARKHPYC